MTKTMLLLIVKLSLFSITIVCCYLVCIYTVEAALLAVNNAIDGAAAEEILVALQSDVLDLKDVMPDIAEYYRDGLVKRKSEKQDVSFVVYTFVFLTFPFSC